MMLVIPEGTAVHIVVGSATSILSIEPRIEQEATSTRRRPLLTGVACVAALAAALGVGRMTVSASSSMPTPLTVSDIYPPALARPRQTAASPQAEEAFRAALAQPARIVPPPGTDAPSASLESLPPTAPPALHAFGLHE